MSPSSPNPEVRRLTRWYSICGWLGAMYLINFIAFIAIALYIGGDAVNGKAESGHYYLFGYIYRLGSKDYTEVTRDLFTYSQRHSYSVMISVIPCMFAAFVRGKLRTRIAALEGTCHSAKESQTESK